MTWIAEHTGGEPWLSDIQARMADGPPHVAVIPCIPRSPIQTILVDYVGLEKFALHLCDFPAEVRELNDALFEVYMRHVEAALEAPGRIIKSLENFTAETLGPVRFREWILPVYRKSCPLLHQAGKVVAVHYDGKTLCCRDAIAESPIDMIESLTGPPEGDQTLAECRAAWPKKLFWVNIRVSDYELPPPQLARLVREHVRDAAPDGRGLAFEISEDLPRNWRESVPVILDALREC